MNKINRCKVNSLNLENYYIDELKCWLYDLDEIDVETTQEGDIILWYKDLMIN